MTQSADSPLHAAAHWLSANRDLVVSIAERFLESAEWPRREDLGRAALRSGGSGNVFEVLRTIPAPVGSLDTDDRVRLRVRGLVTSAKAADLLHDFVRVLWLADRRLLSHDPSPKITSADLTGPLLGFGADRAQLVGELILAEDWMFNGGSGDVRHGWERHVNERTRFIAGIRDINDYLRAEGSALWVTRPTTPAQARPAEPADDSSSLRLDDLHPLIADAAAEAFARRDYGHAVQAAWFAVRDLVRQRLDVQLDGVPLMERIGADNPRLALTPLETESDRSMHRGLWHFLVGSAHFVRNPEMHDSVSPVASDRAGALERLAILSLCARHVEAAASPLAIEQAVTEASQESFAATEGAADDLVHSIPTPQRPKLVLALLDAIVAADAAAQPVVSANLRAVYWRALHRLPADDPSNVAALRRLRALVAHDASLGVAVELLTPALTDSLELRYRDKVGRALARDVAAGGISDGVVTHGRFLAATPRLFSALSTPGRAEVLDAVADALSSDPPTQAFAARIVTGIAESLSNEECMGITVALSRAIIYDGAEDAAHELEAAFDDLPEVLRRQLHVQLVMAYDVAPGRKLADRLLSRLDADAEGAP